MALYQYRKFKIGLDPDSKKTQGLRTGDIVRRQFFDGKNLYYTLMCVLSNGKEKVENDKHQMVERAYFVGALLEGDVPKSNELLDFARITNMFDANRSGAMYLTSSDDQSPYMDVIDGIARNKSFCYPEDVARTGYADSKHQYVPSGFGVAEYIPSILDHYRVVHLGGAITGELFKGIKQDFQEYIENPQRVLISYKIKTSSPTLCNISLGYQDGTREDGNDSYTTSTEWEYKLHAITVENSGRHLRSCKIDFPSIEESNNVWIADFNIILLSSIANFGDASQMRIGKLEGVNDKVFGTLEGYGGYMQNIYASKGAHISGTLTAGDENGFGSTFYAGKIHRNVFINSLDVDFVTPVTIDDSLESPTGMGHVYQFNSNIKFRAQTNAWLQQHKKEKYTLSFWLYSTAKCQLIIKQNEHIVHSVSVQEFGALSWDRKHAVIELQPPVKTEGLDIEFIVDVFDNPETQVYFSSPQLEKGVNVTQYQATDDVLNITEEYGAWFSQGGIGGTMQNPLLKLQKDGSIASKNGSFVINPDGSGHLAKGRITWNDKDVKFKGIKLTVESFDESLLEEIKPKSVKIIGETSFVGSNGQYEPAEIKLGIVETNFISSSSTRQWYYMDSAGVYQPINGENGRELVVNPDAAYWEEKASVVIKIVCKANPSECVDTINIYKVQNGQDAYSVQVLSQNGNVIKNGVGTVTLVAHVYKGGYEITDTLQKNDFDWVKTSSRPQEDEAFNALHKGFGNTITITGDDIWNMAQFDCIVRIN